jgi:hypothetical protein
MNINAQDIIWYGPYPCPACLQLIIKASRLDGGIELNCPTLIYPNTVWEEHCCSVDTVIEGMTRRGEIQPPDAVPSRAARRDRLPIPYRY